MANTTSRTVDFAPAWLKLTDDGQERKQQPVGNNHPNNQHHSPQQTLRQNSITIPKYTVIPPNPSNQRHRRPVNRSLSDQGPRIITNYKPRPRQNAPNKQEPRHQNPTQYQQHPPHQPPPHPNQSGNRQQPSKSTTVAATPKPVPVKPVEDFPSLSGKPSAPSPAQTPTPAVQWKGKQTSEQRSQSESDTANSAENGSTQYHLLANKSGQVFRAHVKPIPKRTPVLPVNITEEHITDTDSVSYREMNGVQHSMEELMEQGVINGNGNDDDESDHEAERFDDCVKTPVISIPSMWMGCGESNLSSSVEKEKKLLQEMGWKEEDSDIEDDCIIPEQTPAQLEALFKQRAECRQTLLLKSKQMSLKPRVRPVFTAANASTEQNSSYGTSDGE